MGEDVPRVRVGVWGLGRHARRKILPALHACPETVLVGVTTRDQEVALEEADRYGCRAWPTEDSMLASLDVEAVYVATPTGLHHRHGLQVLQAGKHLWCEKPMTETLQQVEQLAEVARRSDLALCEGLMYLYHPQFSTVSRMVSDASFGDVVSLRSQFGMPPLEQPGFRYSRALGGGALLDLAPYPLSAALELLGSPLTVTESFVGTPSGRDVDTYGYALLTTPEGTTAFLEWGYERGYRNEISVWGERGSLTSEFIFSKTSDQRAHVTLRNKRGAAEQFEIEPADSFRLMFGAFADAVRNPERREVLRRAIEVRASHLERLHS